MHVDLSSVTATLIADELITHHNPSYICNITFNNFKPMVKYNNKVSETFPMTLRLFFYLVGLHYPPDFDFGYSKEKNKQKKTQMAAKLNIVPCHLLLYINSHYVSEITLYQKQKIL